MFMLNLLRPSEIHELTSNKFYKVNCSLSQISRISYEYCTSDFVQVKLYLPISFQ